MKSFCNYMLTIGILVLVAVSFLHFYLQPLKLVLHSEESSTMKSFEHLIHSLIKVVHLNKHLLLKLKLLLLTHHLGKVLHKVKIFESAGVIVQLCF